MFGNLLVAKVTQILRVAGSRDESSAAKDMAEQLTVAADPVSASDVVVADACYFRSQAFSPH